MNYKLVELERFDNLREVWPHEAHHFTHWVADKGLSMLSKEIGIGDIIDPICEVSVGSKRADIVAKLKDANKGVEVIIENQLEATNHEHLGKIVTYSAGRKEAAVVIWIVEKATEEYRKAVEWLNRRTDDNMDFYLVEIQLFIINQETLAPRFKVVVSPSPKESIREWSENDKFLIDFWNEFNSYADSIPYHFFSSDNFNTKRKPYPQVSYDLHVPYIKDGYVFLSILKSKGMVRTGIYLPDDERSYSRLRANEENISKTFHSEIEWNERNQKKKSSSVCVYKKFEDLESKEFQNEIFSWMCDTALKWKEFLMECQNWRRFVSEPSDFTLVRNGKHMEWDENAQEYIEIDEQ